MKIQAGYIVYLFVRKAFGYDKHPFQYWLCCYRHFISSVSVFGRLCWIGYPRVNSWSGMVLLWHVFSYTTFLQSRIRVFCIKILQYNAHTYIYIYMYAYLCVYMYMYINKYIFYTFIHTQYMKYMYIKFMYI